MCAVFVRILGIMGIRYYYIRYYIILLYYHIRYYYIRSNTILCYLNMKGYVTNILYFMYMCIPFVIMYTICHGSAQLHYFAVHICMTCVTACVLLSVAVHADHQNNLGHVNLSNVHKHSDW